MMNCRDSYNQSALVIFRYSCKIIYLIVKEEGESKGDHHDVVISNVI